MDKKLSIYCIFTFILYSFDINNSLFFRCLYSFLISLDYILEITYLETKTLYLKFLTYALNRNSLLQVPRSLSFFKTHFFILRINHPTNVYAFNIIKKYTKKDVIKIAIKFLSWDIRQKKYFYLQILCFFCILKGWV